jgi:DNA-binding beta-propeller fold protein YncE
MRIVLQGLSSGSVSLAEGKCIRMRLTSVRIIFRPEEKPMTTKNSKPGLSIGALLFGVVALLGVGQAVLDNEADAKARTVRAPRFEVDPLWPKPLPNHWLLGMTIGVWVDEADHVWIIHRGAPTLHANERALDLKVGECCSAAPPVLEFDQAGNLVRAWGGPGQGYEWPESNHGIHVDFKGNVWIGGNGPKDAHLLKFTKDGKFLMQVGNLGKNAGSNDLENFGRVAKIWVDPKTNEAYVADGYLNKRVAVLDADTGKMKRYWGAFGNKPDDTDQGKYDPKAPSPQQFRNPVHCVERTNDGLLYVCDRANDRIQVFKPDGTYVKEAFYAKETLGSGSAWDIAFSRDKAQRYIYLADGTNEKVRVIERETLAELTNFGDGGRQPGQFYGVHSIATDSKGNIYTTETYEGKRVQRFVNKGIGEVAEGSQGVPWPKKK